jgi:hypothetical protein
LCDAGAGEVVDPAWSDRQGQLGANAALLAADEGTDLATERKSWFPFGVVRGDSFAYLAVRPALDGAKSETDVVSADRRGWFMR